MADLDDLRVADLMTRTPTCLGSEVTLAEAYAWLLGEGIRGAPVTDPDGDLVGVVSGSDMLAALAPVLDPEDDAPDLETLAEIKATPLTDLIEQKAVTCAADLPIPEACKLMVQHRVRRLVVTEGDRVIGVLSASDIAWAVAGGGDDRAT